MDCLSSEKKLVAEKSVTLIIDPIFRFKSMPFDAQIRSGINLLVRIELTSMSIYLRMSSRV